MAKNKPHKPGYNPPRQNYVNQRLVPGEGALSPTGKGGNLLTESLAQKITQAINQVGLIEPVAAAPTASAAAVATKSQIASEPAANSARINVSDAVLDWDEKAVSKEEGLELSYEIIQAQAMEEKLRRKEVLIQEQQKKIRSLKARITRLEEEARNRNRTIASYQSELIQFSKDLEEKQKQVNLLEETVNELRKKADRGNEIAELGEKLKLAEKEVLGLRTELKQKQQDNLMVSRDLKESKRVYKELQESFDILLAQNTNLEKQVSDLKRLKEEMDSRYTKTLDNLKAEVRLRQGECSKLLRELQEVKKEKEDLERLVDGLELKAEMLSSNNSSLQRKLDKVSRQKALLEEQLNNGLVRFARSLVRLFSGRGSDPSTTLNT